MVYEIIQSTPDLVLRDVGPWDVDLTVTNNIESVTEDLVKSGMIPPGGFQSFLYYDSEGELTGVKVSDGKFHQFYFPEKQ